MRAYTDFWQATKPFLYLPRYMQLNKGVLSHGGMTPSSYQKNTDNDCFLREEAFIDIPYVFAVLACKLFQLAHQDVFEVEGSFNSCDECHCICLNR